MNWQQQLRESIKSPAILLNSLGLSPKSFTLSEDSIDHFPLRVTKSFMQRMGKRNPHDPLLLQVLPLSDESILHPDFSCDPVGEQLLSNKNKTPGILHKYHGRVLLITTGACAVHCRYCFRRDYPYQDNKASAESWRSVLSYIQQDKSISELILSGGDPLVLSDGKLNALISQLKNINHLKRLRVHTRMPIVLPDRITDGFIQLFSDPDLQFIIVVHSNHPNEINEQVDDVLIRLRDHGITLLNQSVLLRGINDKAEILEELNEKLFHSGTLPYYLHMLDKVSGAAHFDVTDAKARLIMHDLRRRLPGYLVPRLVREHAGAPYKIPVL